MICILEINFQNGSFFIFLQFVIVTEIPGIFFIIETEFVITLITDYGSVESPVVVYDPSNIGTV